MMKTDKNLEIFGISFLNKNIVFFFNKFLIFIIIIVEFVKAGKKNNSNEISVHLLYLV